MKVSRRIVLRGMAGVSIGLPLLESVVPDNAAHAQDTSTPPFFIAFRQANGVAQASGDEPERFWPRQEGALTPDSMEGRALGELVEYRDNLLPVGNVNLEGFGYGDGHANGAIQALTARGPRSGTSGGGSEADGESLDHRIGRELNENGNEALYLYAGRNSGWLGGACVSWRGSGDKRSAINNPWNAYLTLVGGNTEGSEAAELVAERRQSINDTVRPQLQRLLSSPRLSPEDRLKLEQHQANIRDLEVALTCNLDQDAQRTLEGQSTAFESTDGDEVLATARLHMQVAALAVACGYTRSVAIQVGAGNDGNTRYRNESGEMMENFHYISHRVQSHGGDGPAIAGADYLHHLVDLQFARTFNYLLSLLNGYTALDGTPLLDKGISLWYNDNSNGPPHGRRGVPYVIAGSAGGQLRQGQYIRLSGGNDRNHDQLLNTIGAAVGLRNGAGEPLNDFGNRGAQGGRSELLA
ncbi:MAG: DUF1552 domain-containing protein [Myxococcota bacterium]